MSIGNPADYRQRRTFKQEGYIDYFILTYGKIIDANNRIGLALCNYLRLKTPLEKEIKNARKQFLAS